MIYNKISNSFAIDQEFRESRLSFDYLIMSGTQYVVLSNLYENIIIKRDLIFNFIAKTKANVSKTQIKLFIGEIVDLVNCENQKFNNNDNTLATTPVTPTQNNSSAQSYST